MMVITLEFATWNLGMCLKAIKSCRQAAAYTAWCKHVCTVLGNKVNGIYMHRPLYVCVLYN